MEKLSPRQKLILEFIEREVAEKGYPPSVREIGEAVGLASSSTVHGHLGKLENKGYIRRDPTKPRAIELLTPSSQSQRTGRNIVNVPIVGKVTAGQPILAVENIEAHFPISKEFIPGGSEIFSLNVVGDSMIEAGIFDGDIVFVRQQEYAENGDIVVALIDDEATIKRFYREADHIRLQPENSTMSPILVKEAVILGKVIGVFRHIR
ncbi:MAG TPA: transcriptional repressor LexA [Firmicutes bacterium]|nr:transcriptional repressor LexA [Bacillota bacterium]